MKKNFLFTSESVSEGHPDKVCDRISDMVVDSFLASEPQARVACETLTTTNKVVSLLRFDNTSLASVASKFEIK